MGEKIPGRVVKCDDLAVEAGGEIYHPHTGEWVEFERLATVGDWLAMIGSADLSLGFSTPEQRRDMEAAFASQLERLSRRIVRWNWTDNRGEPYPEHPSPEDLRQLSFEEIRWLQQHAVQIGPADDDRKNGSQPSTSPSTGRKAARRQASG